MSGTSSFLKNNLIGYPYFDKRRRQGSMVRISLNEVFRRLYIYCLQFLIKKFLIKNLSLMRCIVAGTAQRCS